MAGYKNFQVDRNKNKNQTNIFKMGYNRRKETPKSERLMEGVGIWASFYRANPHRFVKDYLGINLKLFQQILLFAMMHFHYLIYIAARGQGKTFLTAIFCVTRAILYPGVKIIAVAGQKNQGMEIIQKIREIRENSPLLKREISDIKISIYDPRVDFHNGSWIRVVAASEGSRGARSNLLIVDEFRMVPTEIIESVLRRFQTTPRQPGFLSKPEYAHRDDLKERNKQIYLTSAWYKAHESWDRVVSYQELMCQGKSYFVCTLPYQLSIKEGLLLRQDVEDEMMEKTFNEIKFEMEMHALFWGANLNSYFTYEEVQKNRKLTKVYYPKETSDLLSNKSLIIPKKDIGEIRVLSADIATVAGSENDASAFFVARLIPTKNGYERQIVYAESVEGGHTGSQAMRIRQLYHDFDCDYIVIDTLNAGIGIYDRLTEYTTDPQRGIEYQPLSCMNDERLADRCAYPNAPKVVFSIRANAQLNSEIASGFKDSLRRGKIKLPVLEDEAEEYLDTIKGYKNLPPEIKLQFKMPYIQTTLLQNEILNLEFDINDNGVIKLKESNGGRKDRYSAISYLDYFANLLEIQNRKRRKHKIDPARFMMIKTPKLY